MRTAAPRRQRHQLPQSPRESEVESEPGVEAGTEEASGAEVGTEEEPAAEVGREPAAEVGQGLERRPQGDHMRGRIGCRRRAERRN